MAHDPGYQVVARKYRPQLFEQLVGQPHIAQGLASAIDTERVGHAYLFTGARGTGKTSTARIFAKALNCQKYDQPTPMPCGECEICQDIAAGTDIDVIEIDGASNNGVDNIRELRSNVIIRPSRARFKIYIIDEVHMFSTSAFNALLKTLEEPPEHVKFFFCTTDPDKLPITVVSRCQRFDFIPVGPEAIQKRLAEIAKEEEVEIDTAALQTIARRAAGSMRDSQSLFEQLLSVNQGRITVDDVHRMLGTARSGRLAAMIEQLAARDAAGALASIDAAVREAVDAGQLAEQIVGYLRDMLAATVGAPMDIMLHSSDEEYAALAQRGKELGVETLLAVLQIMDQAVVRMKASIHPRVLLEVAVVRICRLDSLDEIGALLGGLQSGTLPNVAPAAPRASVPTPPVAARSASEGLEQKKTEQLTANPAEPAVSQPVGLALTAQNVDDIWRQALEAVGDMTADLGRLAKRVATLGPNRLAVSFPAEYTSQKDMCERPANKTRIERELQNITGQIVKLEFEVLAGPPKPAAAAIAPVVNQRQLIKDRERHPLVQQAVAVFQAEIASVEERRGS